MSKDNLDALLEQAEEKLEKGEALDDVETEHHGRVKDVQKKRNSRGQNKSR